MKVYLVQHQVDCGSHTISAHLSETNAITKRIAKNDEYSTILDVEYDKFFVEEMELED